MSPQRALGHGVVRSVYPIVPMAVRAICMGQFADRDLVLGCFLKSDHFFFVVRFHLSPF